MDILSRHRSKVVNTLGAISLFAVAIIATNEMKPEASSMKDEYYQFQDCISDSLTPEENLGADIHLTFPEYAVEHSVQQAIDSCNPWWAQAQE